MMLNISDFKDVSLRDRDLFARHYESYPQVHSENTFTNMVCWNHYAHYRFALVDDNIVLSSTIEGMTRYRIPIGPQNPDLLKDVMRIALRSKDDHPLVIFGHDAKNWVSRLYPNLKIYPERKYFDYVYLASDLAELPGKKYLTIRHQLNKFQKTCSPQVEKIDNDRVDEIFKFLDLWCDWKDCDSDPMLAHEKEALSFAISHFADLKLSGLVIRTEGKIGALSLFEGLNKDTAVVHFEKGLPNCKGIYRAINAETAKILAKQYTFINRESDLGVEGIREAKTRYHPHHMVEEYLIKKDDLESIF